MRTALSLASLMLAAPAFAADIATDGSCPGPVMLDITGLTPGGNVRILMTSLGEGADVIGRGACTGTVTGLSGFRPGPAFVADGAGELHFTFDAPDGACDKHIQFIDAGSCALTPVVDMSALGGPVDPPDGCLGGAVLLDTSPGGDMVVCDDPGDATCEEDFGALCPVDWHLCSMDEFNSRNDGWGFPTPGPTTLGTIHCRGAGGGSGAGHFTISTPTLGDDQAFNCWYGSSRATCETVYGCNETTSAALCCAPSPLCGNGVVDAPEEQCDDANGDDTDDCLSNCWWKNPADHGFGC
ncbi:MAG: hypothetical protein ACI8PZ_000027 [Myxococcota bacterium]|jgi:hypothetical protein